MTAGRLLTIFIIFCFVSTAWFFLGFSVTQRTHSGYTKIGKEVKQLWKEVSEIFSALSKETKSTLPEMNSSQRVAYLYQHNEAMMLQVMMSFVGKSLVITKHDSIITSSPLSIKEMRLLEHRIYYQLGFKVKLSQGLL